ncbi:putative vimentin [Escherichia coli]|nr:putative vimentin [Escherichia coli]
MTTDVRMAMEEIDTKTRELLTGVCTSLEEELNDYSEAVNAKNSKCWRKKTQNNEGLSPDYGGKFLNGPVSTTRAGRITGNEILPRTAPK